MSTSYTSLLGLALPVTGELSGTWGDTVNNSITSLLDTAIAGAVTVSADTTLTTTDGASNQARSAIIIASGHVANITVTAPARSKIYTIINTSATYTVKIVGVGPTTGVTLGVSEKAQVAWNGSDFVRIGASGGPGVFSAITNTSLTSGRVVYSTTGGLETDSANLLFNGTTLTANTLNLTNALGTASGGTGLTSFTSGGVVYASSGSALSTGSALTFDGTSLLVGSNTSGYGYLNVSRYASSPYASLTITDNATPANEVGVYLRATGSNPAGISTAGAPLAFYLAGPGTSEQMRLTSTGLGIGTSSPAVKLETSTTSAGAVVEVLRLSNPGSGANTQAQIKFFTTSTNYGTISGGYGASAPQMTFDLPNGTAGNYVWQITSSEKMRLDSSGNLGLGVTPSAFGIKAFQVSPIAAIASAGAISSFSSNVYWTGAGSYSGQTYIANGASTAYLQNAGVHAWYQAAAGTAGNAITFTQAMTLDASGNLGVGTSSPTSISGFTSLTLNNATNGGLLDFQNNTSLVGRIYNNATSFYVYNQTANPLIFGTGGVEKMRLDSSGNLGIGTSSPGVTLDVNGPTRVRSDLYVYGTGDRLNVFPQTAGNGANIVVTNNANSAYAPLTFDGSTTQFNVSGTGRMFLNSSGNLGIGTSSPSNLLHIKAATNPVFRLEGATDSGYVDYDGTRLQLSAGGGATYFVAGNAERFRIGASGQLGIGGATYGTAGQVLTSGGASAAPTWSTVSASAAGSNTQIQYNSSGSLAGSSNFTFDGTSLNISSATSPMTSSYNAIVINNTIASGSGVSRPILLFQTTATPVSSADSIIIGQILNQAKDGSGTYRNGTLISSNVVSTNSATYVYDSTLTLSAYKNTSNVSGGQIVGSQINLINSNGLDSVFRVSTASAAGTTYSASETAYQYFRPGQDNVSTLGQAGLRWTTVYATTGTINTSDRNDKQDIEELSAAEQRVAARIKGLIRKFRFKDSVAAKGDNARIHFGVIAQDVQAAFTAEGLDVSRYGLFCSDTFKTIDGKAVEKDKNGQYPEGAVDYTRLGVRYEELLAFVISAI